MDNSQEKGFPVTLIIGVLEFWSIGVVEEDDGFQKNICFLDCSCVHGSFSSLHHSSTPLLPELL